MEHFEGEREGAAVMRVAVSTGTFYQVPFVRSLELIRQAGFEHIELLAHWEGGDGWAMAQHLKGLAPREVLRTVRGSGLQISSLHDAGGVIEAGAESVVSASTYEYLEYGGGGIPCVVFHPPHRRTDDPRWWEEYRATAGGDLRRIARETTVCVENLFPFEGYHMPLLEPADLLRFAQENELFINADITHLAQAGADPVAAAKTLRERVYAVHLSDYAYAGPRSHVFVGEGDLPLGKFFAALDSSVLQNITLECNIAYDESDEAQTVERLRQARGYAEGLMENLNLEAQQ